MGHESEGKVIYSQRGYQYMRFPWIIFGDRCGKIAELCWTKRFETFVKI